MRFKKGLALALTLAIVASALLVFSGSTVVAAEQTTLTVEVFDRGVAGQPDLNNNMWTKYIKDTFTKKTNIKVEFVPVIRSQEVDKLNILMAAGTAPDICFTYDSPTVTKYVRNGGIMQLDDLLKKYGANLVKYMGPELAKYGKFYGKQMVIPAKRTTLAYWGSFIRQDWLDKLKLKAPTNSDELYKTLIAFRDKNPGAVKNVVPWALGGQIGLGNVLESFWKKQTEQEFISTPNWVKPGNKDGLKYLNKLYNEKLISQDFAIDKTEKQRDADLINGNGGFVVANWDFPWRAAPGIMPALVKNLPKANLVPVETFKNYEGKYKKPMYAINVINLMIPSFSKHGVEAVKYMNWLSNKNVMNFFQLGEKGRNYKVENGKFVAIPQTGYSMMVSVNNLDYEFLVNGLDRGNNEKNIKAICETYGEYQNIAISSYKMNTTDAYVGYFFDTPNEADGKYGKTLKDKELEMLAKLISCPTSEFSGLYDSLTKDYMAAGGTAVMDEKVQIYKDMHKK